MIEKTLNINKSIRLSGRGLDKSIIHGQSGSSQITVHIAANNVIFDGEFNPHNVRLFVIGHEFGAIAALWADSDQDALDTLCDENLSGAFIEEDQNQDNDDGRFASLGNAGELHNLDHAWILEVELIPARDWKVMLKFAEARGGNYENLDKV